MSQRSAASKHQIPNSTLRKHLKKPEMKVGQGKDPVLTRNEELEVVSWIKGCVERGSPRCSLDVIAGANKLLHRRLGSSAQELGRGWLYKFRKRHNLSHHKAEHLSKASANLTQDDIEGWFATVSSHVLKHENLVEAISDPSRVFNADETMMKLNSSADTVLAPKGMKNVFSINKDDKAGLTVMATFSADGSSSKPFIVYPYERVPGNLQSAFPHDRATLAATKSGWMQSETFCFYLRSLAEEVELKKIKFPIILFVDNHSSHTSLDACETAKEFGIELVFLYPNSTFLLQPADVTVFRCLKSLWKEENRKLRAKEVPITKLNFAELFLRAFTKIPAMTIKTGFFKCGLCPLDSSNVDYTKCIGKKSSTAEVENFSAYEFEEDDTQHYDNGDNEVSLGSQEHIDQLEIALQHPVIFFNEQLEPSAHMELEYLEDESLELNNDNLRSFDDIIAEQNREMIEYEPLVIVDEPLVIVDEPLVIVDEPLVFVDEPLVIMDEPLVIVDEPLLKLPPTPKRQGKRNIKRTHPFSSQNMTGMRESQMKKAKEEEDKKVRKIVRTQKKKELIAKQIESAKLKMAKASKKIDSLTQQQCSI